MDTMCVCGKYVYSTLNSPWIIYTMDLQGRVIGGVCVHGVHFPLQQNGDNSKKNMSIRGGYNGKCNNNINGLVGNIGGIISDSSSQV